MDNFATERRISVFRDHPKIVRDFMFVCLAETTFEVGSVLQVDANGKLALLDGDAVASTPTATVIGVYAGAKEVKIGTTEKVLIPVAVHADAVLDKLVYDTDTVTSAQASALLKEVGVFAY